MIVVVIVIKRKLKEVKSNIFLLMYFTANIMVGMFFLIGSAILLDESELHSKMAVLSKLIILIAICSYCAVAGLSGDRLMAIQYPMLYQRKGDTFLVIHGVLSLIIISLTILANLLLPPIVSSLIFIISCIVTGTFVCIANLKVRHTIKEKFYRVGDRQVANISEEQKSMELKKTRICLVLAFSFVILGAKRFDQHY